MAAAKKTQNVFVWILMGLLVLGLAGFGVDGILSQRVQSIGSVGGQDISTRDYMSALQDEMRRHEQTAREPMPMSRMIDERRDGVVRARLVTQAALDAEAARIGISVGDETVMRSITATEAFFGPGGSFDRDTYRFQLENAGLTPSRYEDERRREVGRGIMQAATAAGMAVPENLRGAILAHWSTPRDFSVFVLEEEALSDPLDPPDTAALEAYHQANIERFTAPEIRAITYVQVTPGMLIDQVEVDPEALQALYDSRADQYRQPERRLVERLIFPDRAAAEAAMASLDEGASFEDLVSARGLDLDDVDMGDMSEAQLGAAGPAVFALEDPDSVTGPHDTPLGPALFRMNAILSAQEQTLAEVEDELRAELAGDAARRMIADAFDEIEDLLAGGATLEDLAAETLLELGSIDWFEGMSDGIAAHTEFRTAAAAASESDFPTTQSLANGGIFALRLDGITPPAPRPLSEVMDEVEAGARLQALNAALTARAETLAPGLASMGLEAFAEDSGLVADSFAGITRLDRLPMLPAEFIEAVHGAEEGQTIVQAAGGQVFLGLVTRIEAPDSGDEQTARLVDAIDRELGDALAQDVFTYFTRSLERELGFQFNEAAIQAVHDSFP